MKQVNLYELTKFWGKQARVERLVKAFEDIESNKMKELMKLNKKGLIRMSLYYERKTRTLKRLMIDLQNAVEYYYIEYVKETK